MYNNFLTKNYTTKKCEPLAYIEKNFKNKEKALAYFEKMTFPNFQGFFEDVFEDG